VWGTKKADRHLSDQVRDRLGFSVTAMAVKAMTKKLPKANYKANGPRGDPVPALRDRNIE
jgi:hypothetical protein